MITYITVGSDRIMLTAYNPRSAITMAKCMYLLMKLNTELPHIDDSEFDDWLRKTAPQVADKLDNGWVPETSDVFTIDPRNAIQEARIVAMLVSETREQGPLYMARPTLDLKETNGCRR